VRLQKQPDAWSEGVPLPPAFDLYTRRITIQPQESDVRAPAKAEWLLPYEMRGLAMKSKFRLIKVFVSFMFSRCLLDMCGREESIVSFGLLESCGHEVARGYDSTFRSRQSSDNLQ